MFQQGQVQLLLQLFNGCPRIDHRKRFNCWVNILGVFGDYFVRAVCSSNTGTGINCGNR